MRNFRATKRRFAASSALLLSGVTLLACGSEPLGGARVDEDVAGTRERVGVAPGVAGFSDSFERKGLQGWTTVGGRRWQENTGALTTLSPGTLQKTGGTRAGFILSEYPSADDGTFETTLALDAWGGNQGGVVFRWSSPTSFYYVSLQPGNQWTSKLTFHVDNTNEAQGVVVASQFVVGSSVKLKIEAQGSTFKFYLDGVLKATVQDGRHAFGRVGYAYSEQWNNYMSVQDVQWVDAPGSTPSKPVDPRAGKVALTVKVKDEGYDESNVLKPRILVENTGEVTVGDFNAYYLFTAEPGKVPVLEDWYTPESTPTLISLGDDKYAVEFQFSGLELAPGETTPNPDGNVVGIHYADWSALDKSNDYSNPAGRGWQISQTIPVEGVFRNGTTFNGDPNTPDVNRVVGGTIPSTKAKMKRLVMYKLRCEDTTADSDFWGQEDNVVVVVVVDKQQGKIIPAGDMDEYGEVGNDDDPKNYYFTAKDNESLEFTGTARVSIYDIEGFSLTDGIFGTDFEIIGWEGTDFIGGHDLDPTPGPSTTKVFSRDGKYRLYYQIEEFEVDKVFATLAEYQLNAFETSTKPGMWAKIDKTALVDDMKKRLKDPAQVQQGGLNYCAPASTTYLMVDRRPLRFVTMVRSLYETGTYAGAERSYSASGALRGVNMPTGKRINNRADWIVMSTLSDTMARTADERIRADASENPVYVPDDSDKDPSDLRGTRATDHKAWMRDILGYMNVDHDTTWMWGEESLLSKADEAVKRGGAAMLGVNSGFFEGEADPQLFWDEFAWGATHTIAYVGNLTVSDGDFYDWDSGNFKFKYWTWGSVRDKSISEGRLEDSLFHGTIGR